MAKAKNIDEYLAGLEGNFAHPILSRVRELVHQTVPQIQEAIKWGSPSFEYNGLMMSMVAFKNFAAVWFHKGALFNDPNKLLEASSDSTKAMRKYIIPAGQVINEDGLRGLINEAVIANESGAQVEGYNQRDTSFDSCAMLEEALSTQPEAKTTYAALSPSRQREYNEYILSAKQQATRERRLKKSLELLSEGKGLNDKYRK